MYQKRNFTCQKKVKPLSYYEVKQAKLKAKDYFLADGQGLFLRIKPTGAKSWVFQYKPPHSGNRTKIGFGRYPAASLADAREKRREALELLAKGIDPPKHWEKQAQQARLNNDNTLERVTRQWFAIKKTQVTPGHADDIIRSLENHILPTLGKTPITDIKAPATIDVLKIAASSGKLEMVKRIAQRLNEVMTYAVNTGLIDANPLSGIRAAFKAPVKENYPTLKPGELPELMKALNVATIRLVTRCMIEFQLHTMVRPNEAAGARWDEIDLENNLWTISAERMKMKRPHTVPLSPQVIALLRVMRPISGASDYIFPSDRDPKKHANKETANVALKRMGFKGRLVAHGLRSLASTTLNEKRFDADIIEAALAHVDGSVRGVYNRAEYLERRRVMMAWWSGHIEKAATGNMSLAAGTKALKAVN